MKHPVYRQKTECDLCGKKALFHLCIIYIIDGEAKLLCPVCAKEQDEKERISA